jgi:aminoglycoside phosphotransferase family enzyme/predicted kinase
MSMTMNDMTPSPDQSVLAAALLDPNVYEHPVERVEKLETHISYIFLAGSYAYKVKKAVNLGFLDFSTLPKRHFYCLEELRLNRRLAPAIYLDVIPITGSYARPVLGGEGKPVEYAVKMRRFAQEDLLDALLARDRLTREHIDRLAEKIAAFHGDAAVAAADKPYGSPEAVRGPALENFAQIRNVPGAGSRLTDLEILERWTVHHCQALAGTFHTRKERGFVRECHGDFHLGNVAVIDDDITIFDCLEFSANLRWIDVMNDVAFLVMDLHDRKRPDLAQRFLNRYLEITGDYEGLRVLRFYLIYRAMVRAKVHALRAAQPHVSAQQKTSALNECGNYVALARRQIAAVSRAIIITHGLSGSGKTTHTQELLETTHAVRVRSDIERKRQRGLAPLARSESGIQEGLYAGDATALTYRRLLGLAETVLEAGYIAIVDATFLKRSRRDAFHELAASLGVPFLILDFLASETTLRQRILGRQRQGRDASEADIPVLEHQLKTQEPLQPDELASVAAYDSTQAPAKEAWNVVLRRLVLTST